MRATGAVAAPVVELWWWCDGVVIDDEVVDEPTLRRGEEMLDDEMDELPLLSADAPVDERALRMATVGLTARARAATIHGSAEIGSAGGSEEAVIGC